MDLSSLGATFEANKTPILAAAGAGVVGLGLYAKKKKATTAGAGVATAGGASSGGQTAGMTGGAAYDSSASDLYGAIQPQLESLGGQLTDLRNLYASSSTPPTPVPAPTPAPVSTTTGTSTPGAASVPTPVPAGPPSWQSIYSSPGSTTSYLTGQMNSAGGSAAYAATPGGTSTGMIYNPNLPAAAQTYETVAAGLSGQTALLSRQALPQTGSLGPVGTVFYDGGQKKKVTGYTFNGMPNVSWLYD